MEGTKEEELRREVRSGSGMEQLMPTFYPPSYRDRTGSRLSTESSSGQSELDDDGEGEGDEEYSTISVSPSVRSSGGLSTSRGGRSRQKKSNVKYKDHCDNCLTADTPQWRKGRRGETFCQDCGRSERRHDYARLRKRRSKAISKILKDVLENSTFISAWDDSPESSSELHRTAKAVPLNPTSGSSTTSTGASPSPTSSTSTFSDPFAPKPVNGATALQVLLEQPTAPTPVRSPGDRMAVGRDNDQASKPVAGTAASELPTERPQYAGEEPKTGERKRGRDQEAEVAGHIKRGHMEGVKREGEEASRRQKVAGGGRGRGKFRSTKEKEAPMPATNNMYAPFHLLNHEAPKHDPSTPTVDKRKKATTGGD